MMSSCFEGAVAMKRFAAIIVACCILHIAHAYKPILAMHGIGSGPGDWKHAAEFVAKYHPGTAFFALPVYEVVESYVALREQVSGIIRFISNMSSAQPGLFGQGYHLLCHSQGALLCRCIAQEWDGHNVSAFVSIAGPHVGVFDQGWFKFVPKKFRNTTLDAVYRVMYTRSMQRSLSVANMWHDPARETAFLEGNTFLPEFLGLVGSDSERLRRKTNLLRVSLAAFFVGSFDNATSDGGIGPWQSGVFGYYDDKYEIVPLAQQLFFINDTIGLKSLNDSGRLLLRPVPGIRHSQWLYDEEVFKEHILPLLL